MTAIADYPLTLTFITILNTNPNHNSEYRWDALCICTVTMIEEYFADRL